MASHTGRVFLNSCLKVPIDPCNNCPAPIYNRPKMYLGRFSTTPMRSTTTTGKLTTTATTLKTDEIEADAMWTTSTGIRSLAKFYDSIPDYCDISNLPEDEFYCTLDTLKTTCRQLKTKSLNSSVLDESSNTSTLSSHCGKSKSKKSTKKKTASGKSGNQKKSNQQQQHQWSQGGGGESRCVTAETLCSLDSKKQHAIGSTRRRCFKQEFAEEVEELKKTLKDFEEEFKRPISSNLYKPKLTSFATKENGATQNRHLDNEDAEKAPVPVKPSSMSCLSLKKSFSFNDLHALHESNASIEHSSRNAKPFDKLTRAELLSFKDRTRLSNYFMQKSSTNENNRSATVPKIVVESPSSETLSSKLSSASTSRHNAGRRKKSKSKKCEEQIRIPFTLFDLKKDSQKDNTELRPSPSPVHPVARPNLAATLRAEVSKKIVKELRNNCTFHDTTPQFDWEVRKTPAWRSLSMNESHKEILMIRLATRKAEQELQRREYDLNMELMRQRVKSAPLLLEGETFWGPNVGKLSHNCQREGQRHHCQSNQKRRQRQKSASSSRCGGESGPTPDAGEGGGGGSDCGGAGSRMSNRMHTLRKIYASSVNYSRNSLGNDRSTRKENKRRLKQDVESGGENDSGDELLSSVDRAYL